MDKVLIFDLSNILYSSFFVMNNDKRLLLEEDKKDYWRYLILSDILNIKKRYNPKEIILAIDSKNTWRKDVFKYYKARRVFRKQKSPIDWDDFHKTADDILEGLSENFPCKTIKVKKAEADDIIATLALNLKQDKQVIIATKDKDFKQLLIHDDFTNNIIIYDLYSREEMICDDPVMFRMLHILKGDSGDDVPNILSDDNVFVTDGKRQKRITQKVIGEMLELGLEQFAIKHGVIDNYERNCKLIDLDLNTIPEEIQIETMEQYNNNKVNGTFETLMKYINDNNMYSLLEEI